MTNFLEYWFEFVYFYDAICIHLNKEIVNYNSMILVTTIRFSRGDYFWIKLNLFVFFGVKLFFQYNRCSRQFVLDWKDCLEYIWADRNNRQMLLIPGLGNIFRPYVLKINYKIFLIYASENHIRIFHRLFLIHFCICISKPHKNLSLPVFNICISKPHKNLSPSVFNICISKPHKNLSPSVFKNSSKNDYLI